MVKMRNKHRQIELIFVFSCLSLLLTQFIAPSTGNVYYLNELEAPVVFELDDDVNKTQTLYITQKTDDLLVLNKTTIFDLNFSLSFANITSANKFCIESAEIYGGGGETVIVGFSRIFTSLNASNLITLNATHNASSSFAFTNLFIKPEGTFQHTRIPGTEFYNISWYIRFTMSARFDSVVLESKSIMSEFPVFHTRCNITELYKTEPSVPCETCNDDPQTLGFSQTLIVTLAITIGITALIIKQKKRISKNPPE